MKQCTECKTEKPLSDFWKDRSKKHGYSAKCKTCKKSIHRNYRRSGSYDKARYWKDPDSEQERHLVRKYGVTLADYDSMFYKQNGKCAICKTPHSGERRFDVDHCHKTGKVRGLLCTNCNRMIGHSHDNSERLRAAAKYLESSRRSRRKS